jgi:superfamily II RNA helicase
MHAHRQAFFKFPLDSFQEQACEAIDAGENVLVCAPTGAGKTAIAEWAMMVALTARKRCLYTTPLKALSNQKFFDLCDLFGESYVGLSTGDVSVRGKADLVVMTTEVYRNMLYGNSPTGQEVSSVARVASVILDEVHFMNDSERGTVWEESIIYTPREVQMIALSATVANAEEMRDWLQDTHGPTRLISTDFRPVPLRHFYFRKGDLLDVFSKPATPGGKPVVNPRLLRFKEERAPRRRDGQPAGATLCEPRKLVERLQQRDMLPAIYFVFSRKGCEKLLEETRGAVHLTREEARALDQAVLARAAVHPEILEHPDLDSLRRGMAVHHAGILPLWKSLVEGLFAQGLVKVVFATETLAAGINMPARTTVISALSKYTGEGLRPLTGSEMLQMSGRAGRRGMDKAGNVVIGAHPKEPVEMVISLARAKPEPLESHFQPSYGMVLNLLQRRPLQAVKELLDRSFGQFLHRRRQESRGLDVARLGEEFQPPCPGQRGDRKSFLKLTGRRRALRAMLRDYDRALGRYPDSQAGALLAEKRQIEQELSEIGVIRNASPCHSCPVFHECGELYEQLGESDKPSYWDEFQALASVLTEAGHLAEDKPTEMGRLMAQLRADNVYAVGEALLGPVAERAERLEPPTFAAVCCLLISEPVRRDPRLEPPAVTRKTRPLLTEILLLCEDIEAQQLDHGVDRAVPSELLYCGVAEMWANNLSWEALEGISGLAGGDLYRILRRTYDLCRQVENWHGAPEALRGLAARTGTALMRGPLEENLSFFETPEGEANALHESVGLTAELPTLRPLRAADGPPSEEPGGERKRLVRRRKPPAGVTKKPQTKTRSPRRGKAKKK